MKLKILSFLLIIILISTSLIIYLNKDSLTIILLSKITEIIPKNAGFKFNIERPKLNFIGASAQAITSSINVNQNWLGFTFLNPQLKLLLNKSILSGIYHMKTTGQFLSGDLACSLTSDFFDHIDVNELTVQNAEIGNYPLLAHLNIVGGNTNLKIIDLEIKKKQLHKLEKLNLIIKNLNSKEFINLNQFIPNLLITLNIPPIFINNLELDLHSKQTNFFKHNIKLDSDFLRLSSKGDFSLIQVNNFLRLNSLNTELNFSLNNKSQEIFGSWLPLISNKLSSNTKEASCKIIWSSSQQKIECTPI